MKNSSKKTRASLPTDDRIKGGRLRGLTPRYEGKYVSKTALDVIWKYYIRKLKEYTRPIQKDPNIFILKTDCDNEVLNHPKPGGIVGNAPIKGKYMLLEIDPIKVRQAKRLGYNIVKGDIRRLPFRPRRFDMIFDFSTIDHIHPDDVESAIRGYRRALKNDGLLYLVAWCSRERSYHEPEVKQYYFEYYDFRKKVEKHFKIRENEILFSCQATFFLMTFLCTSHKMHRS